MLENQAGFGSAGGGAAAPGALEAVLVPEAEQVLPPNSAFTPRCVTWGGEAEKPSTPEHLWGCACLWPGDSGDSWQAGWVAGGWAPSAGLCCDPMKGKVMSGTWGGAGTGVGAGCMELRVGGPKGDTLGHCDCGL